VQRPLQFEARTLQAARAKVRDELGADVADLSVVRHGRELSGGIFGFFQRARFVIEVEEPSEPAGKLVGARRSPNTSAPEEECVSNTILSGLVDATSDTTSLTFAEALESVLADAQAAVADVQPIYAPPGIASVPPASPLSLVGSGAENAEPTTDSTELVAHGGTGEVQAHQESTDLPHAQIAATGLTMDLLPGKMSSHQEQESGN